jgi:hypothetical protein
LGSQLGLQSTPRASTVSGSTAQVCSPQPGLRCPPPHGVAGQEGGGSSWLQERALSILYSGDYPACNSHGSTKNHLVKETDAATGQSQKQVTHCRNPVIKRAQEMAFDLLASRSRIITG